MGIILLWCALSHGTFTQNRSCLVLWSPLGISLSVVVLWPSWLNDKVRSNQKHNGTTTE